MVRKSTNEHEVEQYSRILDRTDDSPPIIKDDISPLIAQARAATNQLDAYDSGEVVTTHHPRETLQEQRTKARQQLAMLLRMASLEKKHKK